MNLYDYVAWNDRAGASNVVHSYGLQPANHPKGLAQQLAHCVSRHKEPALEKIIAIHPDRSIIESTVKEANKETTPTHSNACGCASCNGYSSYNGYSYANGQDMKSDVKSRLTDKTELLITGGIVLIGLAMVLKLMK